MESNFVLIHGRVNMIFFRRRENNIRKKKPRRSVHDLVSQVHENNASHVVIAKCPLDLYPPRINYNAIKLEAVWGSADLRVFPCVRHRHVNTAVKVEKERMTSY